MNVTTSQNVPTSLQVSSLGNVLPGSSNFGRGVVIKNITEYNITVEVKLLTSSEFVSTVLYPGWNPEIIMEIKGVTSNTLQYGY